MFGPLFRSLFTLGDHSGQNSVVGGLTVLLRLHLLFEHPPMSNKTGHSESGEERISRNSRDLIATSNTRSGPYPTQLFHFVSSLTSLSCLYIPFPISIPFHFLFLFCPFPSLPPQNFFLSFSFSFLTLPHSPAHVYISSPV